MKKLLVTALAGGLLLALTLMAAAGSNGFPRDDGLVSYSFAEDDFSQYVVVQYDPDKTESIQVTITSLDLASTATYAMDDEGGRFTATSTAMGQSFSSFGSPGRMQLEVSAEEMGYEIELALEARDGERVEEKLRMYFDEFQTENCADDDQG